MSTITPHDTTAPIYPGVGHVHTGYQCPITHRPVCYVLGATNPDTAAAAARLALHADTVERIGTVPSIHGPAIEYRAAAA